MSTRTRKLARQAEQQPTRDMSEDQYQAWIVEKATAAGWVLQFHVRRAQVKGRWLTNTSSPGVPDLWLLRPSTGQLVVLEVKQEQDGTSAERIQLAKEAAKGITRLPYGDELQDAHDRGDHAEGLVPGCPACDAEQAALDAEAGGEPAPEQPPTEPTPIAGRKRRGAPADS
jgi:hypothetical protein